MSGTRRVAQAAALQVLGRLASLALSLATAGVLGRTLSADGFGLYSNAVLYGSIAAVLTDFGLVTIGIRELEQDGSDLTTGDLARIKTVLQLPAFGLLALLSLLLPSPGAGSGVLALGIACFAVMSLQSTLSVYAQRAIQLGVVAVVDVASRGAQLVLVVILVRNRGDTVLALEVLLWTSALGAVVLALVLHRLGHRFGGRLSREPLLRLVRDAAPLAALTTVGYLHFKGDSVLLSLLKPERDLGIYSVAYRVIETYVALPSLFLASALPLLARAFPDPVARRRAAQRCLDLLTVAGLPLIVGTIAFAPSLVDIVAGHEFTAAAGPLRVLSVASLFAWFNTLFATLGILGEQSHRLLVISLTGLAVNLMANALVIPAWSYDGAAVVTAVTESLGSIAVAFVALRQLSLQLDGRRLLVTLSCCSLAAVPAAALGPGAAAVVFVLGCPALMWVTGAVRREDLTDLLARSTQR